MSRNYIKAILEENEIFNIDNGRLSITFEDDIYEVFSYMLGDGLWAEKIEIPVVDDPSTEYGFRYRKENEIYDILPEWLKEQVDRTKLEKQLSEGLLEMGVKVPFTRLSGSVRKKSDSDIVELNQSDAFSIAINGSGEDENGKFEPDSDRSPLRQFGFI